MCFKPKVPKLSPQQETLAVQDMATSALPSAATQATTPAKKKGLSQLVIDLTASGGTGLNLPQ